MTKKQPSIRVRHAVAMWPVDAPRGAVADFCREHGVSRAWFYQVRAAAAAVGPVKALEKKPPVALSHPAKTPPGMVELLLGTRAELMGRGFDYGALSVIAKLRRQGFTPPSPATVSRIFSRAGVVIPEPRKKPRHLYIRFVYARPNECWQIDAFEWRLADGSKVAVFQLIDDHSRLALATLVACAETSAGALAVVAMAIERHGVPQRFLSDNGAAFNPSRRGRRGELVEFLKALGVEPMTGKPGKPTTQGKNERFHRTLHKYLEHQEPAATMAVLQTQIDEFDNYYNNEREHQSLNRMTPQEAWKATPAAPAPIPPEPDKEPDSQRQAAQRKVAKDGTATIIGTHFNMGKSYVGETINILYDTKTIMFFTANGTEIITHPIPPKGTPYIGNGQPRGFMINQTTTTPKTTTTPAQTPTTPSV